MRRGVTLIELIFVIVILGLVGMIAIGTISHFYKGSYYQNQYAQSTADLDRTLAVIEKNLKNAIRDSIVLLDGTDGVACQQIASQAQANNYTLGFISIDEDSRRGYWDTATARYQPGWTGEATVTGSGVMTLLAPEANFNYADTIIQAVSGGTKALTNGAIYRYSYDDALDSCTNFRWIGTTGNAMEPISAKVSATTLQILGTFGKSSSVYQLAWTGKAFQLSSDGNLSLYTNFQPWSATNNLYTSGTKNLVATNVSHFSVRREGNSQMLVGNSAFHGEFYRVNVCMKEVNDINSSSNTLSKQVCKEKSIYVGQ